MDTRRSILQIAAALGHRVEERRVSLDEWQEGAASGQVREVFACGTAAVVTPVGRLASASGDVLIGDGSAGPVTTAVRQALLDVQQGRAEDVHGWMHRLV
jgi:branched-chain amino acid aminotransferase